MVITDRDRQIIETIAKFRIMLGRQIKILCGFSGTRATDRRLSILIQNGFIQRSRVLYGIAGLYQITDKSRKIFDIELPISQIRVEQIVHDIAVIDTAIYFIEEKSILLSDIKTEKQARHEQGFGTRGHDPDFTFNDSSQNVCVEVELNLKAKNRLLENIKRNFAKYDSQIWVIPRSKLKIREIVSNMAMQYPNIEILSLEKVQEFVNSIP